MSNSLCQSLADIISRLCSKKYNGDFHVTINESGIATICYSEAVPERTISDFISQIAPAISSMVFQRSVLSD